MIVVIADAVVPVEQKYEDKREKNIFIIFLRIFIIEHLDQWRHWSSASCTTAVNQEGELRHQLCLQY